MLKTAPSLQIRCYRVVLLNSSFISLIRQCIALWQFILYSEITAVIVIIHVTFRYYPHYPLFEYFQFISVHILFVEEPRDETSAMRLFNLGQESWFSNRWRGVCWISQTTAEWERCAICIPSCWCRWCVYSMYFYTNNGMPYMTFSNLMAFLTYNIVQAYSTVNNWKMPSSIAPRKTVTSARFSGRLFVSLFCVIQYTILIYTFENRQNQYLGEFRLFAIWDET